MNTQIQMEELYIWPSDVLEYLYCPRFIYYERVMMIPQHEELRAKVLEGRSIHEKKQKQNPDYLRKKIGVIDKKENVWMASPKYHFKGVVDEVLFLSDGTAAPLDYKFAEWNERLYKTHKVQSCLYALLIKENFNIEVKCGFIVYIRSKNHLEKIDFSAQDFEYAIGTVNDIFDIIQKGKFPGKANTRIKCVDCCYKNICVQ